MIKKAESAENFRLLFPEQNDSGITKKPQDICPEAVFLVSRRGVEPLLPP